MLLGRTADCFRPVWVSWESLLDGFAEQLGSNKDEMRTETPGFEYGEGDATPTAEKSEAVSRRPSLNRQQSVVHDSVMEVVIAQGSSNVFASRRKLANSWYISAKMIITIWEMGEERFFSLTFTSTDAANGGLSVSNTKAKPRQVHRVQNPNSSNGHSGSGTHSSPSSISSGHSSKNGGSSNSSAITSPTALSLSASPFPPLGPPARNASAGKPSHLQKIITMKDALLDNTEIPILAMWKDESLTIPNRGI